jgi:hypothetical protein
MGGDGGYGVVVVATAVWLRWRWWLSAVPYQALAGW